MKDKQREAHDESKISLLLDKFGNKFKILPSLSKNKRDRKNMMIANEKGMNKDEDMTFKGDLLNDESPDKMRYADETVKM